jgi:hypothetical protein
VISLRPTSLALVAAGLLGLAPVARAAAPLPYEQAVANSRETAHMVLDKVAAESCLRGRLNRAMIKLSDSCAAHGRRGELCTIADRVAAAVPVTPELMREASERILQLTESPGGGATATADP